VTRREHHHHHETDSERNLRASEAAGATVVSATGVAVGLHGGTEVSAAIEGAMMVALSQAQEEGVVDQEELRRRMLAARDQVLGGS
jgi:hypothetical protein